MNKSYLLFLILAAFLLTSCASKAPLTTVKETIATVAESTQKETASQKTESSAAADPLQESEDRKNSPQSAASESAAQEDGFPGQDTAISVSVVQNGRNTSGMASMSYTEIQVRYPSTDTVSAVAAADSRGTGGCFEDLSDPLKTMRYNAVSVRDGGSVFWGRTAVLGQTGFAETRVFVLFVEADGLTGEYAVIRLQRSEAAGEYTGTVLCQKRLEEKLPVRTLREMLQGHAENEVIAPWGPEGFASAYQLYVGSSESRTGVQAGYYNHTDGSLRKNAQDAWRVWAQSPAYQSYSYQNGLIDSYTKETAPFMQYWETEAGEKVSFCLEALRENAGLPAVTVLRWPANLPEMLPYLSPDSSEYAERDYWAMAETVEALTETGSDQTLSGSFTAEAGYYYDVLVRWAENGHENVTAFHFVAVREADRNDPNTRLLN